MTSTSSIKCQINEHVFAFSNVAVRFHISIFFRLVLKYTKEKSVSQCKNELCIV